MNIETFAFITSSSKTVSIYRNGDTYYLSLTGVSALLNQSLPTATRFMKKSEKKSPVFWQKMKISQYGRPLTLYPIEPFLLTFKEYDQREANNLRSFLDSLVTAEVVPAEENYKNISFQRDNVSIKVHVFEDAPDDV